MRPSTVVVVTVLVFPFFDIDFDVDLLLDFDLAFFESFLDRPDALSVLW